MGSYNKFHNNCYKYRISRIADYSYPHPTLNRDGIFVPIITGLSSLYAGFAVFSVAGFMSKLLGRPVEDVIEKGEKTPTFTIIPVNKY